MSQSCFSANVKLPEKQSFCVQVIKYSRLGPLLSRAKYAWISPAVGITVVAQPAYQYMIAGISKILCRGHGTGK
jgi:hypothetical protein